jgi:hypothetical protein
MIALPWRTPPLTPEQERDFFMLMLEDDTEEAPWMVMGDLQFWSATRFAHCLQDFARIARPDWYVASMLPILYTLPDSKRKKVLAPDTFVAIAPDHPRQSFDIAVEGGFPPFVLEVVSPASIERDQDDKHRAYAFLGAQEYALFTPRPGTASTLAGYRRDAAGAFVTWLPDDQGRLWSEFLGLFLVVQGRSLRAQLPDGRFLLTLNQATDALSQTTAALDRAEEELDRLRREVARLRGDADSADQ